jgi:NAD-dependent deacetylase
MNSEKWMNADEKRKLLAEAAALIMRSSYVVVFSGAGISTPSGIPDFRSPDSGLWEKYDPFEVASIWAFRNQPEIFFDWIRSLSVQADSAKPNQAHLAVADLENRGIVKSVITQNIDGLHQMAGTKKVFELHGSARTATCPHCGKKHQQEYFHHMIMEAQGIPQCDRCGKIIKPDVVLFGEDLPGDTWEGAYQECLRADLIFIVGSSLEVSPANSLPESAVRNGAKLIINNLSSTHLDKTADILLKMDVIEGIGVLPGLISSTAP